ncbi:hypothetical protein Nocox_33915 [Nonomuraea coxensis DSM 45129]|uniref:Ig-like domain-containing protein n=1 Tax=Nonomuraea coxensis DSM 45129 TaxID=1122611 RepID=A0ABX8U9B0_9ACTN|nr:hypothetical protein [Nonomuraea coxensis]QYC44350.1 hypothetical protein Nocox_33915 [Nonomuraea coxensis DSM 45129]
MDLGWIIVMAVAAGAPPAAPPAALTCAVATPPGRPLAFTPPAGLTPRAVTVRGNLQLTGCVSPDGSASALRSGWVSLRATADASCTSAGRVRARASVIWFGWDGRPVGTSTISGGGGSLATHRPADSLLTGTVTYGPLKGRRASGGLTPGAGLVSCATQGLSRLSGTGTMTFG